MTTGNRVPRYTKLAFGVGQVAEGVKNTAFATFVLLYYNQVLGLSGTLSGLAIMVALCFDALTDPIAGSLSDNWRSRWGRRHPFMYAAALPLAVAFYFLFSPPESLGETGLFLWLMGFAILTRAAMTLYHVPHLALGAELSEDYEERTSIVSYRTVFGVLGSALTILLGFSLFFVDTDGVPGTLRAEAYPPFAFAFAALMFVTILASALGTHDRIPFLPKPSGVHVRLSVLHSLVRVFTDLRAAVRNRSFRWLFAGVIIVYVMVGVQSALGLYMGNYFWELSSSDLRWVTLAPPIGFLLGAPFTRLINRRFDKKPSLVIGTAWYSIFALSPPILRLLGWFPDNGDPLLVPLLIAMGVIGGAGVIQAIVTAGSMMADIADEHELESGRRQEGIFFGALSFSGKGASGIGNLIGGIGLDLIAFPRGAVPGMVDGDVLTRLGALYGPVVLGFAIIAVWCYSHYHLNRAEHARILEELATRRAGRVEDALDAGEGAAAPQALGA
ncbi:MAG TPA: MFS transporter [Pseudomonadales bacterium]|nr:MFS transporter [Pseudomonadales bacterium]